MFALLDRASFVRPEVAAPPVPTAAPGSGDDRPVARPSTPSVCAAVPSPRRRRTDLPLLVVVAGDDAPSDTARDTVRPAPTETPGPAAVDPAVTATPAQDPDPGGLARAASDGFRPHRPVRRVPVRLPGLAGAADTLSEIELAVLRELAAGGAEAARRDEPGAEVEERIASIGRKLGTADRGRMVVLAQRAGVLHPSQDTGPVAATG